MQNTGHHNSTLQTTGSSAAGLIKNISDRSMRVAAAVKPAMRGWIHLGMTPLALACAIVLISLAPNTNSRIAAVVFGGSAVLLFGVSALYHRGNWSQSTKKALQKWDHSNIFILIAGTYTPLTVILLDPVKSRFLLTLVWSVAIGGLALRLLWHSAPRWVYVPIYLVLGWVAVGFLGDFWSTGGPAIFWLIASGGIAYTIGAIVFATKFPNPSQRWFGFHEIFHVFTVIGFVCHYVAVSMATYVVATEIW